jgi:malonate-semialdehyde dehydrogenase (acetylating)/methylmalonate-semialdehyde dehydrogenase
MSTTALRTIRHRIAGEETSGGSTRTAPVWDPATGRQQAEVPLAEAAAVQAARRAFETGGDVSLTRRARVMFAFRNLVEQHLEDLARSVASEHGKVLDDAKGEVIRGMEVVEYGQPLGVCAGITPFGDHHIHGPEGVRFYTRGKAVTSRWPQEAQDPAHHRGHMHFPTAV